MEAQYNLDNLDAWSEGKHPLVVSIALTILSSIDILSLVLERTKAGQKVGVPIDVPLQQWLQFYRSSKSLAHYLRNESNCSEESDSSIERLFDYGMQLHKQAQRSKKDTRLSFFERLKRKLQEWRIDELKRQGRIKVVVIDGMKIIEAQRQELLDIIRNKRINRQCAQNEMDAQTMFLGKVWLVCLLLYGVYPSMLLRKARLGDLEAMELLIRLDPSTLHDRVLAEKVHRLSLTNPHLHKTVVSWATKPPSKKFSKALLKKRLGGFLAHMSYVASKCSPHPPLSAPDILSLFDAYAKDSKQGLVDPDLADQSPESFAKAMQRERDFWKFYLNFE